MKIERTKEWWLAKARLEDGVSIGAGPAAVATESSVPRPSEPTIEESRIAFGKFVALMRRRLSLTIEELSARADLDLSELIRIEDDVRYVPGARAVYQLSQVFDVSQRRLMQLAGLAQARDSAFSVEAVRFAARSESVQKLTPEESAALDVFVTVLSQQVPKAK